MGEEETGTIPPAFSLFSSDAVSRRRRRRRRSPSPMSPAPVEEEEENPNPLRTPAPTTFAQLGLSPHLCGMAKALHLHHPTEVQLHAIPPILARRHVMGCAGTGTGKTAAFVLPLLHVLAQDPIGVHTLVLAPTRELAFQIADQFSALGAGMTLHVAVLVGGLDALKNTLQLIRRPHVVVATPGRLAEIIRGDSQAAQALNKVRALVLDEADRLLDPTFERDLTDILSELPDDRQMILFSASMTDSMEKLKALVASTSEQPVFVYQQYQGLRTVDPSRLAEQMLFVPAKVKEVYLAHMLTTANLEQWNIRSVIVFVATTKTCLVLELLLKELGVAVAALHSHKAQKYRLAALGRFKARACPILVATDVASRGLDIPSVDLVLNYDLPRLATDYVHRVGRTARAERKGRAISLVSQHEVKLVQAIEAKTGNRMESVDGEVAEEEVMKQISRVFAARRRALLKVVELEQDDPVLATKMLQKKKKKEEREKREKKREKT